MRRFATIPIIWLAGCALGLMGCVPSPLYHPGPHSFATLDSIGDAYLAVTRGSAATNIRRGPTTVDALGAFASGPVVWAARASHATADPGCCRRAFDRARQTEIELGVGTRAGRLGPWRMQDFLAVGRANSDATLSDNADDYPEFRAHGNYWRAYAQRTLVLRTRFVDIGLAARVSAVHADRFERLGFTAPTTGPPTYTRVMPDSGSRTGVFFEPGIAIRFGGRNVKVGPELSLARPLVRTAFGAQPSNLSIGITFNLEPTRKTTASP